MKTIITLCIICALFINTQAQKPTKQPSKAEMDKMMDDALKGMSKEDAAMMKEMMKQQQGKPSAEQIVNLEEIFKDNKQLIPAKNGTKISAVKKKYNAAEVTSTVNSMYTKLLAKGNAAQIAMAKKAMLVAKTCTALMDAANTAMLQGQPHTALLLSLKAVQTCPTNLVAQNNVAALLTQYGYPEQAIPFLQKLNEEVKGNSTVLNNLAFGWLGLGDTEKAYQFAGASVRHNPQHPQSRLLCGVILEAEGKTEEAKQQIEIAKKFNNTSLTEQIGKNNGVEDGKVKMSWAEIKKKISVYEYFPKGWRKTYIPEQNNIEYDFAYRSGALSDQRTREAFGKKMTELIKAKKVIEDAESGNQSLMLKKVMQTTNSQIALTKIANNVTYSLFTAFLEERNSWDAKLKAFAKQSTEIFEKRKFDGFVYCRVKDHRNGAGCTKEHSASICAENTPIWASNCTKMMKEYNPQWLAFKAECEEEIRFYYNALLTWLLLGNTPALEKANEIAALEIVDDYFQNNYGLNLNLERNYLQIGAYHCNNSDSRNPIETILPLPEIPNLNCLVIFKIPSGFGSLNLSNKGFSAADNEYGITANNTNKSPTMSTSLGTSGNRVSEPGLYKDPYTNTSNGNTEPVLGTPDDDELTPLPKNTNAIKDDDELATPPKPSSVNSNWNDDDLTPIISDKERDLRDARNTARELLDNAMSTSCNTEAEKKSKKNKAEELKEKIEREFLRQRIQQDCEMSTQSLWDYINNLPYDERVAAIKQKDIWDRQLNPRDSWYGERMVFRKELFLDMEKKIAASEKRRLERKAESEKIPIKERERTQRLSDYYNKLDAKIKDNLMQTINMFDPKYDVINGTLVEVLKNNGLTPTQNNGFNLPGKIAGFVSGFFN